MRVCRASSQAVVVRPPALVDVVEGVRDPLLLQHSVPLFTEKQGLATAGGTRIEILLWLLLLFLFPVPGSLAMWLLCTGSGKNKPFLDFDRQNTVRTI